DHAGRVAAGAQLQSHRLCRRRRRSRWLPQPHPGSRPRSSPGTIAGGGRRPLALFPRSRQPPVRTPYRHPRAAPRPLRQRPPAGINVARSEQRAMIPRYSRPEMVAIWSPETRFRIWFEIEAHATTALAQLGVVPKEAAAVIWEKGGAATFDVARIDEIERTTKHDVIAFLTHLAEIVGPEARFVHQGMTSSDVLDTCLSVQLTRA